MSTVLPVNTLPEPLIATVVTVPDGDYAKNLPTLALGYFGAPVTPNPLIIQMIDQVALDRDDDDKMSVAIFSTQVEIRDDDDEYVGDAEIYERQIIVDPTLLDDFFDQLHKINKFKIIISSETYYFEGVIECEGLSVISSTYKDRLLH